MGPLSSLLALLMIAGDPAGWTEDLYNFRGKQFDFERLVPLGNLKYMQRDDAGLITALPADARAILGIKTNRQVIGDFQISASFDVLKGARPSRGTGVGAGLEIEADRDVAGLKWIKTPAGDRVFVAYKQSRDRSDSIETKTFPATVESGTLRMERAGKDIKYFVSEDNSKTFRELHSVRFSESPIRPVRISVLSGGGPNEVTVRWSELKIHAERILEAGQRPPASSGPAKWLALALVCIVLVIGVGTWWWKNNAQA